VTYLRALIFVLTFPLTLLLVFWLTEFDAKTDVSFENEILGIRPTCAGTDIFFVRVLLYGIHSIQSKRRESYEWTF